MSAVMRANNPIAMTGPPGTSSLMVHGQSADGRTNHARNETRPSHGPNSGVAAPVRDSSNAVSQTIPTMR